MTTVPRQGARSMHFYRDLVRLHGGDLKLWHYFCHVAASGRFVPAMYFSQRSIVDDANPWIRARASVLPAWEPGKADALFLAGTDWRHVPDDCTVPALNLVQNMRHVDLGDERYGYLRRRAFRISINAEITEALAATGVVNGPVATIRIGTDVPPDPHSPEWTPACRPVDVVIAGMKNPTLAATLDEALRSAGHQVQCVTAYLPRTEFLALLRRARVAVTLPKPAEGFFLPPLEALANGCIPVCPDVPGTRHYREHPAVLSPDYRLDAIVGETRRALALAPQSASAVLDAGVAMVREHSLDTERQQFLGVLDDFETFCGEG